jgi:hypothetical protein
MTEYQRGLYDGMRIAQDHAWISTHDGWFVTNPLIVWENAEKELADAVDKSKQPQ